MKRRIILLFIIVAALAAAGWVWHLRQGRQELVLSGNVDIREVNLAFRVSGRLRQLQVDEGAHVHTGDRLGELDPAPYDIALEDARASHEALQARRTLYHAGNRAEDIAQARANLAAREAALSNAERLLQRQLELAPTGATTDRAVDDARSQRDQAAAQAEATRQQLLAMEKGFRQEEVAEVGANERRARAQIAQAELQRADTVLYAPSDGTIITRAVEPGAMLASGTTVLTLSLDQPVWVRAYAGEADLGKMAPSTRVLVYTDARAEPYEGTVGFVSPTAEFTPKNVETQDLRTALVYRLRIVVQKPDAALRQGMPVTVRLAPHA